MGGDATRRKGRIVAGGAGLLFSAVYLLEGSQLSMGALDAPGPGLFPIACGVLLALASLGVIAEGWFKTDQGAAEFPKGADARRLLLASAAFVLYIVLLDVLGFLVMTTLFVIAYVRIVGTRPWLQSLLSGVGVAAGVWYIFVELLGVRLPVGIWG